MKISIAMATYNGARYIREQLQSLSAQTRLPDELVVTDDGSTDGTVEIVREFARNAPFPVRIHPCERNLGYTRNFLKAARLCSGEWIAFCDQDDVWLPEKLATVERYSARRGTVLIVHSAEAVERCLIPTGIRHPDFRRPGVYRRAQLPTWWIVEGFVMTFRADLMTALPDEDPESSEGLPPLPRGHDATICRLARILGEVVVVPDSLVLHRWHGASVTTGLLPEDVLGIRTSRTLLGRIKRVLCSFGASLYLEQSRDAADQARIYRYVGQRHGNEAWRRELLRADRHYRAFSQWMAERAGLYQEPRLWERVLRVIRLSRGYVRFSGGSRIGIRACAKAVSLDLIVLLLGFDRFSEGPARGSVAVRRDRGSHR